MHALLLLLLGTSSTYAGCNDHLKYTASGELRLTYPLAKADYEQLARLDAFYIENGGWRSTCPVVPVGAVVRAVLAGSVVQVSRVMGIGPYAGLVSSEIKIESPQGLSTTYVNIEPLVAVGERVQVGSVIGLHDRDFILNDEAPQMEWVGDLGVFVHGDEGHIPDVYWEAP